MSVPHAFGQGYALCSPARVLLPNSVRPTQAEAIASVFTDTEKRDEHWNAAQAQGMTCQFVYARIFLPQFFPVAASETQETAGAA
ncbi:hypothetical protein ELH50_30295 (plasmid) [Rhizobium ruizarguesonis]|nr:hypothetical protein ELI52_28850 [Rhizobium ruizarguesonis]TBA99365.1 hypothetical protein ELH50_30295 [Rhizobium ruizarguesonis]